MLVLKVTKVFMLVFSLPKIKILLFKFCDFYTFFKLVFTTTCKKHFAL